MAKHEMENEMARLCVKKKRGEVCRRGRLKSYSTVWELKWERLI